MADISNRDYLIGAGGSPVAAFAPEAIHDIRCYYEAMEAFIASSGSERSFRLRGIRERMDVSVSSTLLNEDNALIWEDYFPSELRGSVLVSLMSLLERCLNGVCVDVAVLLRSKVPHTALKGSSIERSKCFLIELCALSGPNKTSWDKMRMFQQLRNIIVHNGGMLESPRELSQAQRLATKLPGISVHEFGVDIEPEFIKFALDKTSDFFVQLNSLVSDACDTVKKFE